VLISISSECWQKEKKMKRLMGCVLFVLLAVFLTGCGGKKSPNGKYVAEALGSWNNPRIEITRNGTVVNSLNEYNSAFSWLPDSSGILVGIYHIGIYFVPVVGKPKLLLQTSSGNYDHNPTFSRDGKWVYFLHHEYGTSCTVYRVKTKKLLSFIKDDDAFVGSKTCDYIDCQELKELRTSHDEQVKIVPREDGKVKLKGYCVIDPEHLKIK